MKTPTAPPILEAVKRFVLEWAEKTQDPSSGIQKSMKIAESTIARMLDPKEPPTERTLLGFNALNFEEATGCSIYGFVIMRAKAGLWGTIDHLPEIQTHKDLVEAIAQAYKEDPVGRFKMLKQRADFDRQRDVKELLDGRPLFWRKIPGALEFVAFYTKKVKPKGPPQGESAFEATQFVPEIGAKTQIEPIGLGYVVTCISANADLICALPFDSTAITQMQRMSVVQAFARIAQKFGITPASLERAQPGHAGSTAIDVLINALGAQRPRR
jgi:hypothetical protein